MSKLRSCKFLLIAGFMGVCLTGSVFGQVDSKIQYKKYFANGDKEKAYGLAGTLEGPAVAANGLGLIIVIPDGKDIGNCESFVKQLSGSTKCLVAQLIPVKIANKDNFVWPTKKHRSKELKFSTEKFVRDVVRDIKGKYKVNPEEVFTLSWGSGGLAGYAISLQESKSITGSYIANSKFDPKQLPSLETAKGHGYLIDYRPSDKIYPESMARDAGKALKASGAKIKLLPNVKKSDWMTKSFSRINYGIRWLKKNHGKSNIKTDKDEHVQKPADPNNTDSNLLVEPLVGVGPVKFGMSKADVIKHLGKPYAVNNAGKLGEQLNYLSARGLLILVHPQNGVTSFDCFGESSNKHFAFTTDKGIKIGATQAQIEAVYGKAEHIQKLDERSVILEYEKMQGGFFLLDGKLAQIVLIAPK